MVQLNPSQLRSFIRKTTNPQVISVICECLLNVVNGNNNGKNFKVAYKLLISRKTKLERKEQLF